jgi:hypothetical protein
VARLDLKTGALARHSLGDDQSEFSLYPAAADNGAFYLQERQEPERTRVFGRLEADSFALTPLVTFSDEPADGSFFTYDEQGKRVAFVEKGPGSELQLVLREAGKPGLTRPLETKGAEWRFGNAVFSRKGDTLLASCQKKKAGAAVASYSLLEIPLGTAPIRETVLIPALEAKDEAAALYFQVGVSHDGKTAAAASTYLACATPEDFRPEDCALFFVDLSDAKRKVTKVLIPLPAERSAPGGR